MEKNTLVIFAKTPQPGKVKTRLAQHAGDEQACAIYEQMLHQLIGQLRRDTRYHICLYIAGEPEYFTEHFPGIPIIGQEGADLGERLWNALRKELRSAQKVIIIGTDCPTITPDTITTAFSSLSKEDVVIGPTQDGGYYLIGLSDPHNVFTGITWSTEHVYEQTVNLIKENNLTSTALKQMRDIDHWEDYLYFKEQALLK